MNKSESTPRRVAAYCRVSTEMELQDGSFELQQEYYRQRILAAPDMLLAGIYGDKGKTGRSIRVRPGFQRMMRDCEEDRIDMIVTKSLSRFARNMADCLSAIRRLAELGIPVIFEREGIDTMNSRGELILSIMAGIAQEESASIAENMRWSMEKSNARGEPFFQAAYGYRKDGDGREWRIEPEEARRVRRAFLLAAEGVCYQEILARLNDMECGGGRVWTHRRLIYMLGNLVYTGDCLTNRSFTVYTDRRIQVKNLGERDQYYLEGHHAPIVSRALFQRVQLMMRSGLLHSGHRRRTPAQLVLLADENWKRVI